MVILAAYFAGMLALGLVFARRQKSTEEFFLAGRRIPVWAAAISIVGVSAATFIGAPQDAYTGNLTYLSSNLAYFLAVAIVALFFVPAYFARGISTVYQLLEHRFGPGARRSAAGAFLLGRLLASGARLYIAAIPLALILFGEALTARDLIIAVAVVAGVATLYTLLGGLDAVIWTDVAQTLLFIGAAVVAIVLLLHRIPLGAGEIGRLLAETRVADGSSKLTVLDTRFSMSTDWNLWSAVLGLTLFNLAVVATDQDIAQRLLTFRSARRSSLSVFLSGFVGLLIALVFLVIGHLLYVYYRRPDVMGAAAPPAPPDDTRTVFLTFIFTESPAGIRGLMLAGLFAGAMGALASSQAAMASTVVNDFYVPLRSRTPAHAEPPGAQASQKHLLLVSRCMVVVWGALLTGFAVLCILWQSSAKEKLIPFAMGVMIYAYSGLLAIFLTAVFTRRGSSASCIAAIITGILAAAALEFIPKALAAQRPGETFIKLSLGWRMLFATLAAFAVCILPAQRREPASPAPNAP